MVVPNTVDLDSRVQKVARAAQDAGYRVTVVGAATRARPFGAVLNGVLTLRVPVRVGRPVTWRGRALTSARSFVSSEPRPGSSRQRVTEKLSRRLDSHLAAAGGMALHSIPSKHGRELALAGSKSYGDLPQFTARFCSTIIDLKPDLIYVHDSPLLLAAGVAQRLLEKRGRKVPLIADVHEWWPGVESVSEARRQGQMNLEDQWIPTADAVITVSSTLATWLARRWGLTEPVVVVENGAVANHRPQEGRATLREECELDPDVPLMVYSGAVAPSRGVDVAIRAAATQPDLHLALVCGPVSPYVESLRDLAHELGMEDRFHLMPFVNPESVPWYLSTADIGVAPFARSASHDSALATKISEYVVAGLALLVSDCEAQAEFVRSNRIGAVFAAGDVGSASSALSDVVRNLEELKGRITSDLRQQRSWEFQRRALLTVLQRVAGSPSGVAPRSRSVVRRTLGRTALRAHSSLLVRQGSISARDRRKLFGPDVEVQRMYEQRLSTALSGRVSL
nr:glycosyltransferase family 4 protein [Demequina globuliformis]